MKILLNNPKQSLGKQFIKLRPLRDEIELFKKNLIRLFDKVDEIEREENQKNHVRDFLRETYYQNSNEVNTKGPIDLAIHNGKTNKDSVGVIIEAKRPGNKSEMISEANMNVKSFHELVLYYLQERVEEKNIDIKHLIITNVYEWYIFDASDFEKIFYRNKSFLKDYEEWKNKQKSASDTYFFYNEIAKNFIDNSDESINCTFFDIREFETIVKNSSLEDDKKLIPLFKILSPHFLLKTPFVNDSNSLNDKFYKELLYLMGLEEVKENNLLIIRRKKDDRQHGSLIENCLRILETEDALYRLPNKMSYGNNREEQYFGVALSLCLTWINRILFLKLLEGQLITYHHGNQDYLFLNYETIHDFDELYKLFHQVLARDTNERSDFVKAKYHRVPYLNSSLFEFSELEIATIKINSLDDSCDIPLMPNSILLGRYNKGEKINSLEYFLSFLDAYDFASEGGDEIAENNKTIINASVLGKVFEKINGYKDGSIFTPGFITMYMSRESLRRAVVQKFNDYFVQNDLPTVNSFDDLYNQIDKIDLTTANAIVNSLKICDPAVGSGHFLVSALNELIVIKSNLGILVDKNGRRIRKKEYELSVENDELIILDENGDLFRYNYQNKESQRVQETIFNERKTIIEKCLFGVDINSNSVKICRLRLWIELLKSSYYKAPDFLELETLPNIDINIKHGDSLLSRFALDADLGQALQKSKWNITSYRLAIDRYRNAANREEKREMEQLISSIKDEFQTEIRFNDPLRIKLSKLKGELFTMTNQISLFDKSKTEQEAWDKKVEKLTQEIQKQEEIIAQIQDNAIYKNAFEWRFEFPEVLNEKGDFEGFDVIIGNPPYVQLQANGGELAQLYENQNYKTFARTGDIYCLFYEKGFHLLRPNGLLIFITSNKWMRAGYGENTRKFLAENSNPLQLVDFAGQKIFDVATVDVNILLFSKQKNRGETEACVVKEKCTDNLSDYIMQNSVKTDFKSYGSDSWVILSEIEKSIKEKIEKVGVPLKDWDINIYRGVLTGYNDAFIINGEKKEEILNNCKTEEERLKTIELIRPILRGRDIKRYSYNFADLWLINTHNGIKEKGIKPINIDNYPAVKEHLDKYFPQLKRRQDKGDTPYNLRNCSYMEDFYKPKIVWKIIGSNINFLIDDEGFYYNNAANILTSDTVSMKYLVALLNSKIFEWYFKKIIFIEVEGGGVQMFSTVMEKVPIPQIFENNIENMVSDILDLKKQNKCTKSIEDELDIIIYNFYNITEEEINYIQRITK
jgi:type II restriction/modification system DNA methylase subunit YeeA